MSKTPTTYNHLSQVQKRVAFNHLGHDRKRAAFLNSKLQEPGPVNQKLTNQEVIVIKQIKTPEEITTGTENHKTEVSKTEVSKTEVPKAVKEISVKPLKFSRGDVRVIIEYFRDMKDEIIKAMVDKVCKKKTGFNRALYKLAFEKSYQVVVAVMITVLCQIPFHKMIWF